MTSEATGNWQLATGNRQLATGNWQLREDVTIRALIFDLDDTLLVQDARDDEVILAVGEQAAARHGIDPAALPRAVRQQARQIWYDAPTGPYCQAIGIGSVEGLWARFHGQGDDADPHLASLRRWAPVYRRVMWSRALADCGVDDAPLAEALAEGFMRERRLRHVVFPEVEAVLQDLRRQGYLLAILTNGAPDLQREKVQGLGLSSLFDAIVVSGEVGIGKPDPRIFAHVLEALDVTPAQAAMIGDNPLRDIVGAQAAGIYAVWLNRTGAVLEGVAPPDAEITSLTDLRAILPQTASVHPIASE